MTKKADRKAKQPRASLAAKPKRGPKAADPTAAPKPTRKVPTFHLKAHTPAQEDLIELIEHNDLTFALGPAGTGKSHIAVAMAVKSLREHEVERIVLIRPAVEAGERLGFLPGDMRDKVDPYMRPLYDLLDVMAGREQTEEWIKQGILEIAPLAFIRGRTLSKSFIILDEAQNTTQEQMKMLLTRFGKGFKAVVTGDLGQIDIPNPQRSGLKHAVGLLREIDGIGVFTFADSDVVRHPLVMKIVRAYEGDKSN